MCLRNERALEFHRLAQTLTPLCRISQFYVHISAVWTYRLSQIHCVQLLSLVCVNQHDGMRLKVYWFLLLNDLFLCCTDTFTIFYFVTHYISPSWVCSVCAMFETLQNRTISFKIKFLRHNKQAESLFHIQRVALANEPCITLIILTPMKTLQRNLSRSTLVVWEMKKNVSVVRFKFRCNILISGTITKEMSVSVASGTPCISRLSFVLRKNCWLLWES